MQKIAEATRQSKRRIFYFKGGELMENLNQFQGKLTVKQEKFCLEYAKETPLNLTNLLIHQIILILPQVLKRISYLKIQR